MKRTDIEYLDYTYNPLAMRCTPISEGCENCWHIRMADRLKNNWMLPGGRCKAYAGNAPPVLVERTLNSPLQVKTPGLVGVQFMGDLFHESLRRKTGFGTEWERVYEIYDVMIRAPWHTFFVLTKRPENAKEFYSQWIKPGDTIDHIWIGTSVELQKHESRIGDLLQIPGKHFLSLEPMLGPVYLDVDLLIDNLDWVICGGESGPGARPVHPDWVRSVRDQCRAAGVPFFMKQMDKKKPIPDDLMIREYPIGR